MDDRAFLAAFDDCTLPLSELHHRGHLRAAFLLVRRGGPGAFVDGLRRYVRALGKEAIYNETLTQAWLALIAAAMQRAPSATSLEALLADAPELADAHLPERHYSRELLFSDAARAAFVAPDRSPLPSR